MSTAAEVVASRKYLLLDFDGPVCAVFGALSNKAAADELRRLLGSDLPAEIAHSPDPFDVLQYAASTSETVAQEVEQNLRQLEVAAVAEAPATDGAASAIKSLNDRGHRIIVVSNNSAEAVRDYLESRELADFVLGVSARAEADPALLKPNPYLLNQAMHRWGAGPAECVMLGDSASDIEAARAAGAAAIAYANKPGKRAKLEHLMPAAVIDSMTDLL